MKCGWVFAVSAIAWSGLASVSAAQNCVDPSPNTGWSNPNTGHLANVNTLGCSEKSPDESTNGTELYFHRQGGCGAANVGLWFSIRTFPTDDWGLPQRVLDTFGNIIVGGQSSISSDALTLYFSDNSAGQFDIWFATREDPTLNSWTVQGPVGGNVNTTNHDEKAPSIAANGTLIYFCRMPLTTPGDHDIYRGWGGTSSNFPIVNRENVLSQVGVDDLSPEISSDYSYIVFDRGGANSMNDGIHISSRDVTFPMFPPRWCAPAEIDNSDDPNYEDKSPCISGGNRRIHFRSTRPLFPPPDTSSNIWVMIKP